MPRGTITTLTDRGFGVIQPDGGDDDLFFHRSTLQGLVFDQLRQDQPVEFDVEPDTQNPSRGRASHVRSPDRRH